MESSGAHTTVRVDGPATGGYLFSFSLSPLCEEFGGVRRMDIVEDGQLNEKEGEVARKRESGEEGE